MQIQEAHQISNKQEQTRNFQWHIIVKTEKRERAESSKKKKSHKSHAKENQSE